MNEVILDVKAVSGGWWVGCDLPIEPTFYRSGARAEQMARALAVRLSEAGHDVRLLVNDRAHQLVATQRYFGG